MDLFAILRRLDVEIKVIMVCLSLLLMMMMMMSLSWISFAIEEILVSDCRSHHLLPLVRTYETIPQRNKEVSHMIASTHHDP